MPIISVAVGAKEAEATLGSFLTMNFFMIFSVIGFALTFFLVKLQRGLVSARTAAISGSLAALFGVLGIGIEHYWMAQCPIHPEKLRINQLIFRNNIKFLESRPADVREKYPYWVSDGTMLDVIRDSPHMKPWDHDTDVAMLYDLEQDPGAEKLKAQVEEYWKQFGDEYKVYWRPDAQHLQVMTASRAHGDIWVWTRGTEIDGEKWVTTPSRLYKHINYRIKEEWLVPTKHMTWHLDDNPISVSVPNSTSGYLTWLFGPTYMKPYRNRIQCMENIWIHAHAIWKTCYVALALAAAYAAYKYFKYLALGAGGRVLPH